MAWQGPVAEHGVPEGSTPPDAALPTVGLASDPGVLEINVAPCATWSDYDHQLDQLYAAAASVASSGEGGAAPAAAAAQAAVLPP